MVRTFVNCHDSKPTLGCERRCVEYFFSVYLGTNFAKAVRSASSWGFVVGLKHGTGCE